MATKTKEKTAGKSRKYKHAGMEHAERQERAAVIDRMLVFGSYRLALYTIIGWRFGGASATAGQTDPLSKWAVDIFLSSECANSQLTVRGNDMLQFLEKMGDVAALEEIAGRETQEEQTETD